VVYRVTWHSLLPVSESFRSYLRNTLKYLDSISDRLSAEDDERVAALMSGI
jgi:hypothetical protein